MPGAVTEIGQTILEPPANVAAGAGGVHVPTVTVAPPVGVVAVQLAWVAVALAALLVEGFVPLTVLPGA